MFGKVQRGIRQSYLLITSPILLKNQSFQYKVSLFQGYLVSPSLNPEAYMVFSQDPTLMGKSNLYRHQRIRLSSSGLATK